MRLSNYFITHQKTLTYRLLCYFANALWLKRIFRIFMKYMPFVRLQSDVKQVIYLNWIIPVQKAKLLVPAGIQLIENNGFTILTVLSYQHGGFAPRFLGKLRQFFPSLLQSNWRFYIKSIDQQDTEQSQVLFIKNIFNHPIYALGTRLFSDALPSHLSFNFSHHLNEKNIIKSHIDAGTSSAESYSFKGALTSNANLPEHFSLFYHSWQNAVQQISQQDIAISWIADLPELAQANIQLSFNLDSVIPVEVIEYTSGKLLQALGATTLPFAFYIPQLTFDVLSEQKISRTCISENKKITRR